MNKKELLNYVPNVVVQYLAENSIGGAITSPDAAPFRAAVLFADIAGFTRLTEELSFYGNFGKAALGTEILAEKLNLYMREIVRVCDHWGGDVIRFAGDAMIAIFRVPDDDGEEHHVKRKGGSVDAALADTCRIAVGAAVDMQKQGFINLFKFDLFLGKDKKVLSGTKDGRYRGKQLHYNDRQHAIEYHFGKAEWQAGFEGPDADHLHNKYQASLDDHCRQFELRVKVGIGAGDVNLLTIGGQSDNVVSRRFEYVAVGSALTDAYDAEALCEPGEVISSPRVWGLITESKRKMKKNSRHFTSLETRVTEQKIKYVVVGSKGKIEPSTFGREASLQKYPLSGDKIDMLWSYVPASIMPYIAFNGNASESWLSELRRVTTLFCQLGITEAILDKLQTARGTNFEVRRLDTIFSAIEQAVFQYEGTINKFLIDDKGSTLLVVFGLPPFAHDDDADRGVRAAFKVIEVLSGFTLKGAIGVTTGVCFCGVMGHKYLRREYGVLGECINLSARLMSEAKKTSDNIFIDKPTRLAMRDYKLSQEFVKLPNAVRVKGFKEPIVVFKHDVQLKALISSVPQGKILCVLSSSREHTLLEGNVRVIRFFADRDSTLKDVKTVAVSHMYRGLDAEGKKEIGDKLQLLWYKAPPEDNFEQGVCLVGEEKVSNFPKDMAVHYFQLVTWTSIRKSVYINDRAHQFVMKTGAKLARDPRAEIEDTFSIQGRLEQMLQEALDKPDRLMISLVEGTYGVGRTYAINNVLNKSEEVSVIRASGDPFRAASDVCFVWRTILKDLLELAMSDEPIADEEEHWQRTSETIEQALLASEKLRKAEKKRASRLRIRAEYTSRERLFHLNELIGTKYKLPGHRPSRIVMRKEEMDARRKREHSRMTTGSTPIPQLLEDETKTPDEETAENEAVIRLISSLVAGLSTLVTKRVSVIIEDSQFMDPFSWLILNELGEKWTSCNLLFVLSHRRLLLTEDQQDELNNEALDEQEQIPDRKKLEALHDMDKATKLFLKNHKVLTTETYAKDSIRATFRTMRTQTINGLGLGDGQNNQDDTYTLLDQVKDIQLLHLKLISLDCTKFYEVRARPEHTEDIMCNILKVASIPVSGQILVRFLREKTRGNPLYINDALKEYNDLGLLQVKESRVADVITNVVHFERDKFIGLIESNQLIVPASVENRCGMILDKLSISGQVALKVASLVPPFESTRELIQASNKLVAEIISLLVGLLKEVENKNERKAIPLETFTNKLRLLVRESSRTGTIILTREVYEVHKEIVDGVKAREAEHGFSARPVVSSLAEVEPIIAKYIDFHPNSVSFCLEDVKSLFPKNVNGFLAGLEDEWVNLVRFGIIEIDWDYYERRRKQQMYGSGSVMSRKSVADLSEKDLGTDKRKVFYKFQNEWMRESLENRLLYSQKREIMESLSDDTFKPLSAVFDVATIFGTVDEDTAT